MKSALWATPLLLLAACATPSSDMVSTTAEKQAANQNRKIKMVRTTDCVFQSSINGFDALDSRYVVLYASGRRKAYLAEISGGCFDMKYRSTLASVDGDSNGRICGYGADSLAYHQFDRLQQCRILSLEQLSDVRRYEVTGEGPPTPKGKVKEDKDDDGE